MSVFLTGQQSESAGKRDYRNVMVVGVALTVALLGYVFSALPGGGRVDAPLPGPETKLQQEFAGLTARPAAERRELPESVPLKPEIDPKDPQGATVKATFTEAETLIRRRQYDKAIRVLHESRMLLQQYAESYYLLGRALEGKEEFATARDFYGAAIDRNPYMADAYWGFATTSDSLGDLESALGAMRSYLHTEPDKDPRRLRIVQARAALWEWEARLGRGPWGPTRGIPPGFTEDELKRDGRGVGIKMPVPGSEQPDGAMKAEIRHGDKIQMFKRP